MVINSTVVARAYYLWAALIARVYEVFPLICPVCSGQMLSIAFITDGAEALLNMQSCKPDTDEGVKGLHGKMESIP